MCLDEDQVLSRFSFVSGGPISKKGSWWTQYPQTRWSIIYGGHSIFCFTLKNLYQLWQAGFGTWKGGNADFDLVRYFGCSITLYPDMYHDYIVSFNNSATGTDFKLWSQNVQPFQMMKENCQKRLIRGRMFLKFPKKRKVWVPRPSTLNSGWYRSRDFCEYTLLCMKSSLIELAYPWGRADWYYRATSTTDPWFPYPTPFYGKGSQTDNRYSYYDQGFDGDMYEAGTHGWLTGPSVWGAMVEETQSRADDTYDGSYLLPGTHFSWDTTTHSWNRGWQKPTQSAHNWVTNKDGAVESDLDNNFENIGDRMKQTQSVDAKTNTPKSRQKQICCWDGPYIPRNIHVRGATLTARFKFFFQWGSSCTWYQQSSVRDPCTYLYPTLLGTEKPGSTRARRSPGPQYGPVHPGYTDWATIRPRDLDEYGILTDAALRRLSGPAPGSFGGPGTGGPGFGLGGVREHELPGEAGGVSDTSEEEEEEAFAPQAKKASLFRGHPRTSTANRRPQLLHRIRRIRRLLEHRRRERR